MLEFLCLLFSALFPTNNVFLDQVVSKSYLTFNYRTTDCCKEVGHIVHQSEKALRSWGGRENKLGQVGCKDKPSVIGLICGLQLKPATPCDMSYFSSLFLTHTQTHMCGINMYISRRPQAQTFQKSKKTYKLSCTQTQLLMRLTELQLEAHAALFWNPMIPTVSRWVSPFLQTPL